MLQFVSQVRRKLLNKQKQTSLSKGNSQIVPTEWEDFVGNQIGMSQSHAAILDDESDAELGRVKKCSWEGEDQISFLVGEGEGPLSLPLPSVLKVAESKIGLLQAFADTKTPAL